LTTLIGRRLSTVRFPPVFFFTTAVTESLSNRRSAEEYPTAISTQNRRKKRGKQTHTLPFRPSLFPPVCLLSTQGQTRRSIRGTMSVINIGKRRQKASNPLPSLSVSLCPRAPPSLALSLNFDALSLFYLHTIKTREGS
jgi:hypothetical protein